MFLRRICCMLCFCVISFAAMSEGKSLSDLERIGTADIIIIGTIKVASDIGKSCGTMTVATDKSLKGTAPAIITIHNLSNFRHQHVKLLDIGTQHIFYLQRIHEGYILTHGLLSLRPVIDINDITNIINNFPVSVLINDVNDQYIFNHSTKIAITITNLTNQPISFSTINLEGFFNDKEYDYQSIIPYVDSEIHNQFCDIEKSIILQPHQQTGITLQYPIFSFNLQNMNKMTQTQKDLITKDITTAPSDDQASHIKFKLAIRIKVCFDLNTPRKNAFDIYYVDSPLYKASIHFANKPLILSPDIPDDKMQQ